MILLELKHLKKSFDELEVIKDFSLSVKEGEVVSIIGPSGSGKSTILRCLTMLEQMDDGEMCLCIQRKTETDPSLFRACIPEFQSVSALQRFEKYHGCTCQCR